MARSAASPAAASAFCHSESTRAQPSACVVIIYDLHSSYRAIGESVRAPAAWPMWRTARGARARASSLRTLASPGPPPCAAGSRPAKTLPQNAQDVELRIGRSTLAHSDLTKYEVVRTYTRRVPEGSGRRGGGCVASARQISGAPIRSLKPVHRCASARLVVGYPPNPSTLLCTS